jgi:hypothetical protein
VTAAPRIEAPLLHFVSVTIGGLLPVMSLRDRSLVR